MTGYFYVGYWLRANYWLTIASHKNIIPSVQRGNFMGRRKSFFHVRKPSLKGKIAARTSWKRAFKAKTRAPRGWGWLTNPKKAAYNRLYYRRTISLGTLLARLFK
jgi:hypothetical protein